MTDLDLEWILKQKLENLANQTSTLISDMEDLTKEIDSFFIIVIGIMIIVMQCGFAFLEAGSVRKAN